MSAEKEIVNFWLNKLGYFTVNNLKKGNKDVGILALKYENGKVAKAMHAEVCCSLTGSMDQSHVSKLVKEKFSDRSIESEIRKYTGNAKVEIEQVLVLNSLPEKKGGIVNNLKSSGVVVAEFEEILMDVMDDLNTAYHKDEVLRTLQITKFLLMHDTERFVNVINDNLSQGKRREFLQELLSRDEIIREFRKTNEERLALILKQSMIKPEKLAEMLEKDVLNKKTRKPFINSLIEQKKAGSIYKKQTSKNEKPLSRFFG